MWVLCHPRPLNTHPAAPYRFNFCFFISRERGRQGDKPGEKHRHATRTPPTTQALALAGNRTGDLLICRPALPPPSHTSRGRHIACDSHSKPTASSCCCISGEGRDVTVPDTNEWLQWIRTYFLRTPRRKETRQRDEQVLLTGASSRGSPRLGLTMRHPCRSSEQ